MAKLQSIRKSALHHVGAYHLKESQTAPTQLAEKGAVVKFETMVQMDGRARISILATITGLAIPMHMIGLGLTEARADQFDRESKMDQILWGWTDCLDIPSALYRIPQEQLAESQALITTIDSSPDVNQMESVRVAIGELGIEYETLGRGVLLPGSYLLRLDKESELFTGFDELWLFQDCPLEPKPDSERLTSDHKLSEAPTGFVSDWLRKNSGFAGLGDGIGLNWITYISSLANSWSV